MIHYLLSFIFLFIKVEPNNEAIPATDPNFGEYWYQGKAEINTYELKQMRYGSVYEGTATLVFVTEDFSKSKQVKLDYASRDPEDVSKVLKLNFVKKFVTGIYPYSMMNSVFTPVNRQAEKHSLKTTTSVQEWCGHTYLQLNHRKGKYAVRGYSYFESEGDEDFVLEDAILEDELWNLIRINPDLLPEGSFQVIPGSFFSRLRHIPLKVVKAKGSKKVSAKDNGLMEYEVQYSGGRSLKILFEKAFPYKIQGWEETYGGSMKTVATKMGELKSAYWSQSGPQYKALRGELGLE